MVIRKNRIWKKLVGGLLFFSFFCSLFCAGAQGGGAEKKNVLLAAEAGAEKETFFELTQEEENYLAGLRGQVLFAGISGAGVWELQNGMDCGPAAPLLDVLRYEFGLEIRLVQGSWEENRAAMQDGGLDFLVGVPVLCQETSEEKAEGELPVLPETGLHRSAWLYESPYVIVEGVNRVSNREEVPFGQESGNAGTDDVSEKDMSDQADRAASRTSASDGTASEPNALNRGEGTASGTDASGERPQKVLAHVAGDPVCEEFLPYLLGAPSFYIEGANTEDDVELLACADEDAVFAAVKSAQADFGILPEEALFARYPLMDFSVTARLEAYGSRAALGIADERLVPLIALLNRYLEATEEGDALREAMRVQQQGLREEKIRKEESEILQDLQARGQSLAYGQAGLDAVPFFWHAQKSAQGELPDFLAFVSECTGLAFSESGLVGEEALQALEDGEILFAAGMPFAGDGQPYCFADVYAKDWLVPVIPAADAGQFSGKESTWAQAVAHRYWGVAQEFMPLLAGTAFDGHVVGFADEKTLYEAMRAGEVGGMLITRGSFDALLLSGEDTYAVAEGIAFAVKSGLAFLDTDSAAAGLFGRLWQFYRLLDRQQEGVAGQYRAAYMQAEKAQENLTRLVQVFGAVAAVLAAAFLLALRRRKKGVPKKTIKK